MLRYKMAPLLVGRPIPLIFWYLETGNDPYRRFFRVNFVVTPSGTEPVRVSEVEEANIYSVW